MTIYSHPNTPNSSKYVGFISKFERPEFAQVGPPRDASEARFVGVAQRLQNIWKSTKITIYTHPKTPKSPKYASILSLIPAELQTVTFLIKFIKKLKHSEPDAGRAPNGHVRNGIDSETEAF